MNLSYTQAEILINEAATYGSVQVSEYAVLTLESSSDLLDEFAMYEDDFGIVEDSEAMLLEVDGDDVVYISSAEDLVIALS